VETRRGFLKKGLFGGALLAIGGGAWVALRPGRKEPLPKEPLLALSHVEYSVLAAVARRMLPRGGQWPTPESLAVFARADLVISRVDETGRVELRQLLNLIESGLSTLFSGVSAAPFTTLSPEDQDAVLDSWATSRLSLKRTGYHALRGVVLGVYFANPEVWPAMGYPGPPPFTDPNAVVWKGGDQPRPDGLGVWHEPEAKP
jgi:hypothetical protein